MLHDEIWLARLNNPNKFKIPGQDNKYQESFWRRFANCEVIDASNVADYFSEHTGNYKYLDTDFPNIAPPFEDMFIEFKIPNGMAHQMKDRNNYPKEVNNIREGVFIGSEIIEPPFLSDGHRIKWHSGAIIFSRAQDERLALAPFAPYWDISDLGEFVTDDSLHFVALDNWIPDGVSQSDMCAQLAVPFLTLSFMHCKNTELVTHTSSSQLQKARAKRNKPPLCTYKVLQINPIKKILETEGDIQHTGIKMALHIRGGHFKDYSNHGLFGKYHGLYWWDMHTRGNPQEGVVIKDYEVVTK